MIEHVDVAERRARDPVEIVHRYARDDDREIVAVLASCLAFGNVATIRAKITDALDRIGPDVAEAADDPDRVRRALRGFKHRMYTGDDIARLVIASRRAQRAHGSLGALFAKELDRTGDLRAALVAFTEVIRDLGLGDRGRHLLSDPSKGSAVKRLMLLLRWMVRPADGVDLGLWPVSPSKLLIPVDTHVQKLGYNLGLTDRKDLSWKTAEEITAALRRFDADDPVRFDFPLCHLGMLQRCPSRRDPVRCEGCPVKPVCRHWSDRSR